MTNAVQNFEIAAEALYNEAPSEKGRAFVEKIANMIRAKGDAWIESHIVDLHITDIEVSDHPDLPSIEENRLFYMERWQAALGLI